MIQITNNGTHEADYNRRRDLIAAPHSAEEELSHVSKVEAHILPESRLVVYSDPYSMEADKFRTLRVYLRGLAKTRGIKTLMITSAHVGEGKSVSSLNLAVGLGERGGSRVILVEADLRNPTLTKRLGLEPCSGLSECLTDASDPLHSLRYVTDLGIYVLSAGVTCGSPIQMLNSDRFLIVMQRLRQLADWVVLDCPPVIPVPDVLAIRGYVDGCLWVVRSNVTSRVVVEEAMHKVGRDRVIAILLNEAKTIEGPNSSYYNHMPVLLGTRS